jgi:hypothetical protein
MFIGGTWTKAYNMFPDNFAPANVPRTIDNRLVADRAEMEMLFELYWKSSHTHFPILTENVCRQMFYAFISRCQDPAVSVDDNNFAPLLGRRLVFAIVALSAKYNLSEDKANIYFLFASKPINNIANHHCLEYLLLNTLLVRFLPFNMCDATKIRHVLQYTNQPRASFPNILN